MSSTGPSPSRWSKLAFGFAGRAGGSGRTGATGGGAGRSGRGGAMGPGGDFFQLIFRRRTIVRAVSAGRSGVDVLVSGGPGLAKPVSERAKTENRKQGGARGPPPGALGGHRAAARGSAGGKISGRI